MAFSLDSLTSYNNTVTVLHKYETAINYEFYKAVYAKNIGLVYKNMVYYYSSSSEPVPISQRVDYGVSFSQQLISYGN